MENFKNWKTTILGLLTVLISVLVGFGIVSAGNSVQVSTLGTSIVTGIFMIITGITGLIAIFKAKDK